MARAQSSCSSDGQGRPVALLERFINADCADCWTDPATPRADRGAVVLDWVVPGNQGDNAPLSAVATRDGLKRLEALGTAPPPASLNRKTHVQGRTGTLRVAHGLPVSGYIGASIAFKGVVPKTAAQPWTAWLALVETIPVGTEGTPVARNMVRNLIQSTWDGPQQLSNTEQKSFIESRSMDVPAGMNTGRVRVIGWVQDAQGRILLAAQSRCVKG
ncbi:hypothetical protein B0B52_19455 [Polaromonas sp. A23]|nr:hypothetical protein B0B52_19455 [Polaromonas sp. A23]